MNLQENIQRIKDVMGLTPINEVVRKIDGGFKTDLENGPSNHRKRALGNWQSDNAWDLFAPEGTVVKSYTKGTVSKVNENPKKSGKVYGTSVTIKGDDDYPDIFYTHLKNVKLRQGENIEVGDKIGEISEWCTDESCRKKQEGTHVHIGLPNGEHLKDLLDNPDIKISKDDDYDEDDLSSKPKKDSESFGKNLISTMLSKAFGLNEDN